MSGSGGNQLVVLGVSGEVGTECCEEVKPLCLTASGVVAAASERSEYLPPQVDGAFVGE